MYSGFFINLNRNESRRAHVIQQLKDVNLSEHYQRFEAVDGNALAGTYDSKLLGGELGLWLSHEKLAKAYNDPHNHLHIIEDDVLFPSNAASVFEATLQYADANISDWDLIFTDIFFPPTSELFCFFYPHMLAYMQSKHYRLIDLTQVQFCTTSSYFINKSSIAKYSNLISGQWKSGQPIDIYIRSLVNQRQLKALVSIPFITTVATKHSSVSNIRGNHNAVNKVGELFRQSFFQGADHQALLAEIDALTQGVQPSMMEEIFLRTLGFRISVNWSR